MNPVVASTIQVDSSRSLLGLLLKLYLILLLHQTPQKSRVPSDPTVGSEGASVPLEKLECE